MEVSGQLHVPAALPSGTKPLLPIVQEAGWAPEATYILKLHSYHMHVMCKLTELDFGIAILFKT